MNRLLGTDVPTDEQRAAARRASASRPSPRRGRRSRRGRRRRRSRWTRSAGEGEAIARDRADVAPRHRDRGRRRRGGRPRPRLRADPGDPAGHADAAVPAVAAGGPRAIRETLAGAGLTEVVTHALVAPDDPVRWAACRRGSAASRQRAGGDPIIVTNPLSRDHSVLRRTSSAACSRSSRRTSATAPTTSRCSRSARATAADGGGDARVVAARVRARRRGRIRRPGTARRARSTSTTPRA